jgi:hypothetical protein
MPTSSAGSSNWTSRNGRKRPTLVTGASLSGSGGGRGQARADQDCLLRQDRFALRSLRTTKGKRGHSELLPSGPGPGIPLRMAEPATTNHTNHTNIRGIRVIRCSQSRSPSAALFLVIFVALCEEIRGLPAEAAQALGGFPSRGTSAGVPASKGVRSIRILSRRNVEFLCNIQASASVYLWKCGRRPWRRSETVSQSE